MNLCPFDATLAVGNWAGHPNIVALAAELAWGLRIPSRWDLRTPVEEWT